MMPELEIPKAELRQHSRAQHVATVRFYRATQVCKPQRSLAGIVACAREEKRSGLGLRLDAVSKRECPYHSCIDGCPDCRAHWQAREERVVVARAIAKKFKLTLIAASKWGWKRACIMRICAGPPSKNDLARARRARAAAVEMFLALGYEVELTNDEGGVELFKPAKKWRLRR